MDDDELIIDDDELLDDPFTDVESELPPELVELNDAILHYREVNARYKVAYDEYMAARERLGKAHDAAGLGRNSGFSW